jgi:hypothetical protein
VLAAEVIGLAGLWQLRAAGARASTPEPAPQVDTG